MAKKLTKEVFLRYFFSAIFSFFCSFSLMLPLFLEGKGMLYCCIVALPLAVFVFTAICLLSKVTLCVESDEFKNNLSLFAFAAGSLLFLWGGRFLFCFRVVFQLIVPIS